MGGKVNGVMGEVIKEMGLEVIGNEERMCVGCEGGEVELNVMEGVLVFKLVECISIMNKGLG